MTNQLKDSTVKKTKTKIEIDFKAIPVGKSVFVEMGVINENSLRNLVSNASKKLNKRFRCIKHLKNKCFEIAHVKEENIITGEIK